LATDALDPPVRGSSAKSSLSLSHTHTLCRSLLLARSLSLHPPPHGGKNTPHLQSRSPVIRQVYGASNPHMEHRFLPIACPYTRGYCFIYLFHLFYLLFLCLFISCHCPHTLGISAVVPQHTESGAHQSAPHVRAGARKGSQGHRRVVGATNVWRGRWAADVEIAATVLVDHICCAVGKCLV